MTRQAMTDLYQWGLIGALVLICVGLLMAIMRQSKRFDKMCVSVGRMNEDLEDSENEIDDIKGTLLEHRDLLRELTEQCATITRQAVRPPVPSTNPMRRTDVGRHSSEFQKPIPSPYGPRQDLT